MATSNLKHFYIPEEQSIYLLSHQDAQKLKAWLQLCKEQLMLLGYKRISLIGKGAFGFAFEGVDHSGRNLVFKFSRANLPQHVQDRLEEEAFMLSHVEHPHVPAFIEYQRIGKQAIMVMERAKGLDLEHISLRDGPLDVPRLLKIALQMSDVLNHLRSFTKVGAVKPIVHGDVKPSNIVYDEDAESIGLIDWGSSVFAQIDAQGQYINNNVMDLMSGDLQQTNARLGDVYFIGDEQLNGEMSSPRFDEQGLASTIYALASGQSCRFGRNAITANGLGLPKEFAEVLTAMLSSDLRLKQQAGDYFLRNMYHMANIVLGDPVIPVEEALIPCWHNSNDKEIDTVVYSSRKSFLREEGDSTKLRYLNDEQFERYYKSYMQGMGENEKAFVAAVSRLGRFPVVGGLVVRWENENVFMDSSLNLNRPELLKSFISSVNSVVRLACSINRRGIFKSCMFNARDTLHVERESIDIPFIPKDTDFIFFSKSVLSGTEEESRHHSYFEDGDDPDELLELPKSLLGIITKLNDIHHTGCIIFEVLALHLKVHSYYKLLDHSKEDEFRRHLQQIVRLIPEIKGEGISGFMKLPYKDTRIFQYQQYTPDAFYPKDPRGTA